MIQTWLQLKDTIKELEVDSENFVHIQKIYSTTRYICFVMRFPGKTRYVYLGRGNHYEGLWISSSPPASELRLRDRLLEYCRKRVNASRFIGFELHPKDRLIKLNFYKWGTENGFYFFYSGRKSYFACRYFDEKSTKMKSYLSWQKSAGEDLTEAELYKKFEMVGLSAQKLDLTKTKPAKPIEELLEKELKSYTVSKIKEKKRFKNKKQKVEQDLRRVQNWREMEAQISEDPTFLTEGRTIKLHGWKFVFESGLNMYQRRDRVYQKIKNLKKAEKFLSQRLDEVKDQFSRELERTKIVRPPTIEPVWGEQAESIVQVEDKNEYSILKINDSLTVAVGRTARGNDSIRNSWAKKHYVWFHLEDRTSSHLIVNCSIEDLDPDRINLVGNILAKVSGFSGLEIPLIYTQVSNLKSVKGTPGKVRYKKEKRIYVILDQSLLDNAGVSL